MTPIETKTAPGLPGSRVRLLVGTAAESLDSYTPERLHRSPMAQVLSTLVQQAIRDGASDIHLQPGSGEREKARIRYRLDGVLKTIMVLPDDILNPLIAVLKLWADLDMEERRRPQSGRISIRTENNREYDLRVHLMPTAAGESAVMRIIDQAWANAWTWDSIGLQGIDGAAEIVQAPRGLGLFVGPTGSGKGTALYAAVRSLDAERLNIILLEEELGLRVPGVYRAAPDESPARDGAPWEDRLRDVRRQDFDVIAIGELRDRAEALAALDLGTEGRRVLSTFHAEDGVGAIQRLAHLGATAYQIANGLSGTIASRLLRRICSHCKAPCKPPAETLQALGMTPGEATGMEFYEGKGCEQCHNTGYRGRLPLYETMQIDEETARLIAAGTGERDLRGHLRERGFVSFRDRGMNAVQEGRTTPAELLRVLGPVPESEAFPQGDKQ